MGSPHPEGCNIRDTLDLLYLCAIDEASSKLQQEERREDGQCDGEEDRDRGTKAAEEDENLKPNEWGIHIEL
jgi:hypothetical protein